MADMALYEAVNSLLERQKKQDLINSVVAELLASGAIHFEGSELLFSLITSGNTQETDGEAK